MSTTNQYMKYRANWKYQNIPESRIDHLKRCPPYFKIINSLSAFMESAEIEFQIDCGYTSPVNGAIRPLFYVKELAPGLGDWFFNGLSGYRAQYYLSPANGLQANRYAFKKLEKSLVCAAERAGFCFNHPDRSLLRMDKSLIIKSLRFPSAKIWGDEHEGELQLLANSNPDDSPQIIASRWIKKTSEKNPNKGIKAPQINTLKFHGAFIKNGVEVIPKDKVNRSEELHNFGFS